MHAIKVKLASAAGMLHYDAREPGDWVDPRTHGETLDETKTSDNYAFMFDGEGGMRQMRPHDALPTYHERIDDAVEQHKRTTGKAVRSDAVGLIQWCVTLPKGVEAQNAPMFFAYTLHLLRERYGEDAVLGGFIHMDESTPHMHVPVLAVKDGRFQAKNILTRHDMQTIHSDFDSDARKRLDENGRSYGDYWGFRYLLDDDALLEKSFSKMTREEMNAVKSHIASEIEDGIASERFKIAAESRKLEEREQMLDEREMALRERESAVKRQRQALADREKNLDAAILSRIDDELEDQKGRSAPQHTGVSGLTVPNDGFGFA